jgi:flagella basal body P-ring formation protein FlgA
VSTRLARWSSIALLLGALPATTVAQPPRVPIAAHEIARGVVLAAADIGYQLSERSADSVTRNATAPADCGPVRLSDCPTVRPPQSDTLVGWMTRRLIAAGEPLRAPAVEPPQLVKSGDVVDVVYMGDGVRITMRGRATRSAALGERLTVRMDNQRKLEATVVAAGRVRVN